MSQVMDVLRGPVLGVIFMIILMAGVILVAAFAALVAQFGLLLRWRTLPVPNREPDQASRTEPVERTRSGKSHSTPQVVAVDPVPDNPIDADWWPDK